MKIKLLEEPTTPTKTYLRSNFIARQKKETELLNNLYRTMEVGHEYKFMRASRVAEDFWLSTSVVDSAVRTFEQLGILVRRLEFGGIGANGKPITGRSYHWTLLVSKETATALLEERHKNEREATNKPPAPPKSTVSLKTRILDALNEQSMFPSMDALVKHIRRPGENLDYHNVTHVLESIVREGGKISFDRGSTKDRVPYNIRLSKTGVRALLQAIEEETTISSAVVEVEVVETPVAVIPVIPDELAGKYPTTQYPTTHTLTEKYPTVRKLVKRREWLEQAAKLAENAEEEDVAIMLLERSNKPLSQLETEAIEMFFELFAIGELVK